MMNVVKYIGKAILLLGILLLMACPSPRVNTIPPVFVGFRVYPFAFDSELIYDGGYKVFPNEGYNGVFVYRITASEFVAYDMACPNDYDYDCTVTFDSKEFVLVDKKCCKTKFNFLTGFPTTTELPSPLQAYKVQWIDGQTLYISNL